MLDSLFLCFQIQPTFKAKTEKPSATAADVCSTVREAAALHPAASLGPGPCNDADGFPRPSDEGIDVN